jgi:hypothetical protein
MRDVLITLRVTVLVYVSMDITTCIGLALRTNVLHERYDKDYIDEKLRFLFMASRQSRGKVDTSLSDEFLHDIAYAPDDTRSSHVV